MIHSLRLAVCSLYQYNIGEPELELARELFPATETACDRMEIEF
jgi:hypothetical protein